jgi:hypothetical protein
MSLNRPALYAAAIVVTILSFVAVLGRFGIRWARKVGFGADDWTALVGLVSFDTTDCRFIVAEPSLVGCHRYNGRVANRY